MKHIKLFEDFINKSHDDIINEGVWSNIMKGVNKYGEGPWAIVAIKYRKVIDQDFDIKIKDAIPAHYEAMKRKHPHAKIHIDNSTGITVWNESLDVFEKSNKGLMSQTDVVKFLNSLPSDFQINMPSPIRNGESFRKDTTSKLTIKDSVKYISKYDKSDGELTIAISNVVTPDIKTKKSMEISTQVYDPLKVNKLIDNISSLTLRFDYSDFDNIAYANLVKNI
mgnify:CR=1 FL=1